MTAPLATFEEFADRIPGGVEPNDAARAAAALDDASALVRSIGGQAWTTDIPDIVKAITLAAAKRAFINPEGVTQEGLDGYSVGLASASPDVYLTKAETARVRAAGGRSGVWTQSTTRADDGIGDVPAVMGEAALYPPASEEYDPFGEGWKG